MTGQRGFGEGDNVRAAIPALTLRAGPVTRPGASRFDPGRMNRPALPDWPRLMAVDLASAYLGLSPTTLREKGPTPKEYGKRRLYDRHDLDRWADRLGGQPLTVPEMRAEAQDVERRFMERRKRA